MLDSLLKPAQSAANAVRIFERQCGARFPVVMTFELIESAQERRRAVRAPHLVALVRAGARFERGGLIDRDRVTAA